MEQLSGWLEYRLVTDKLDPPVFRCRLRPSNPMTTLDDMADYGKPKLSRALLSSVAEWDLADNGVAIPPTEANKAIHLSELVGLIVEGRDLPLGLAILQDAQKRENFLKN